MKITKRAFIEAMVANSTIFAGVTKRLLSEVEAIEGMRRIIANAVHCESRTCKARSRDLVFSNGSHLDFNQVGSYEFYKFVDPDNSENEMYACCHNYHDDFDNKDCASVMWYILD